MTTPATPSDMVTYFDSNVLGDLLSDTGTPVASADLATNAKLLALLDGAHGRVLSALTVAAQYDVDDIEGLTGVDLQLLKEMECYLAFAKLLGRRPGSEYRETYQNVTEEADEFIDRLRQGERVFSTAADQQAAQLMDVDGPTAYDYQTLNLLRDRTRHYYPSRQSSLPIGR